MLLIIYIYIRTNKEFVDTNLRNSERRCDRDDLSQGRMDGWPSLDLTMFFFRSANDLLDVNAVYVTWS